MADLFNRPISITLKTGSESNINTSGTKLAAEVGELHYCQDTEYIYIYNGSENVLIRGTRDPVLDSLVVNGNITGSGHIYQIGSIAAAYTIGSTNDVILASGGNIDVTLPNAADIIGATYTIKKYDSTGSTVVDGSGTQTIDGDTTVSLIQDETITVSSDGARWYIL